jgi:riboflavin synthase
MYSFSQMHIAGRGNKAKMFTGIIKEIGRIESVLSTREGKRFVVKAPLITPSLAIDDSVAINGVCQTVTSLSLSESQFVVEAVAVSLQKTTLAELRVGDKVHLELALAMGERLGGHFVSGHVSGVAPVVRIEHLGKNKILWFAPPASLQRYMVLEGPIALDGVSLTLCEIRGDEYAVSIIPHTFHQTLLGAIKPHTLLNIEVDMMAKYVENFFHLRSSPNATDHKNENENKNSEQRPAFAYSLDWLKAKGF